MAEPVLNVSTATRAAVSVAETSGDHSRGIGERMVDALRVGNPVGVPLREVAGAVAGELGRGADPVAAARLEQAALDFGREAKAFAIGNAAAGGDAVRARIDAALDAGAAQADRFDPILTGVTDRITAVFEGAAAHLRQQN